MASEELRLVQPQRMENGSSSRMAFREDSIRFPIAGGCVDHRKSLPACGFVMEGNKLFPNDKGEARLFQNQEAALRRSLYGTPGRIERDEGNAHSRGWNVEGNDGSGSRGDGYDGDGDGNGDGDGDGDEDDGEADDGVEDDELDEGDGEVDGLVCADLGNANKNNNNSSGSVQSSSEKICTDKANVQEHHSFFGLSRTVLTKCGNEMRENSGEQHDHCEGGNNYENAITVVEPELYCSQIFHGGDGSTANQKALRGDNGYGFNGRRESSFPLYSGESLRAHLSDPVTGSLMDDAIILACGHSFGSGGMQHVQRIKACFKCSLPISEDSARPNLALRAAVQAFLREEESHSLRLSKRRRDRFEQDKYNYDDQPSMDSRSRGVQFPFNVSDRVIIKGNKRTPQRFVGRLAVVTTQCLNGWYVVKTLDNAESVKLQYRSLSKAPENSSNPIANKPISSNWL
ncbi:U-box domain-containing protein 62-like [Phalaenopsis equestris]|uniref:U-box domain-containing protein 62-like n=1 Tax=Phalaenopsis equestris TaxID=78828 RepID=UPI0009E41583|nr:U-box domain-containing protein 62-like [Phalaenopsis equestris]